MAKLIESIVRQLEYPSSKTLQISGVPISIDYCVVRGDLHNNVDKNIFLVAGFGSGWRGIAELGYYLAVLGWNVAMISLPGYGNSDNPPKSYYKRNDFSLEARVVIKIANQIFPRRKVHFIGHSMGAAIINELAYWSPSRVLSLTMLNPAGFEKVRGKLWLMFKFVISGVLHRLTFRGDSAFRELDKLLPSEKSPFSTVRLIQRLSEIRRICLGGAMQTFRLGAIGLTCPVFYITGERDFVVPIKKSALVEFNNVYGGKMLKEVVVLNGFWHNTTMFGSDKTAQAIERLLRIID